MVSIGGGGGGFSVGANTDLGGSSKTQDPAQAVQDPLKQKRKQQGQPGQGGAGPLAQLNIKPIQAGGGPGGLGGGLTG